RSACSSTSECRSVPPVAAISTGISDSVSSGSTSKNDLNSPLNEASKAGVTAITLSASATFSKADSSSELAKPVSWVPQDFSNYDPGVGVLNGPTTNTRRVPNHEGRIVPRRKQSRHLVRIRLALDQEVKRRLP